ncbi:hypoxanthine phosphoribosyltransferase, partial [Candidatus Hakubella thermalkaliphila]
FAHKSEAEFAKILDFYRIEWEYEPKSFAIEWDEQGKVTRWFTPDFYLPEFDLYIELTTMNQRLVTKKNQKLRLMRELYPDVRCKLFYKKDFDSRLLKYK